MSVNPFVVPEGTKPATKPTPPPVDAAPALPEATGLPDLPPPPPEDVKPKGRPTTRAGRRAAAAANKAKAGGAAPKDKKPAASTPRKAQLETRLTDSLTMLGMTAAGAGAMLGPAFTADGMLIMEHAESVSKALCKVADNNPAVKASLERMLTAGVYSGLVAALLPVVIGIAANHGAIPKAMAAMFAPEAGTAPEPTGGPIPPGFSVG